MHNKYNEGDKCADYSGYTGKSSAWYNGRWCFASIANCPDARAHKSGATGTVPTRGYGASRAACTGAHSRTKAFIVFTQGIIPYVHCR